jgi:hypothetical protein
MKGEAMPYDNPAKTAGPNHDGSRSLASESKVGILTTLVLTAGAQGAIGLLGDLDLSTLPGWSVAAATAVVAAGIGLLTAYVKKNRAR